MLPSLQKELHFACCQGGDGQHSLLYADLEPELHARKTRWLTTLKHTPTGQPPAVRYQMDNNEQNVPHFR